MRWGAPMVWIFMFVLAAGQAHATLRILATDPLAHALVKELILQIDGVQVEALQDNPAVCIHDYQLIPKDVQRIHRADVVLLMGQEPEAVRALLEKRPHQIKVEALLTVAGAEAALAQMMTILLPQLGEKATLLRSQHQRMLSKLAQMQRRIDSHVRNDKRSQTAWVVASENAAPLLQALQKNVIVDLGHAEHVNPRQLQRWVQQIRQQPQTRLLIDAQTKESALVKKIMALTAVTPVEIDCLNQPKSVVFTDCLDQAVTQLTRVGDL